MDKRVMVLGGALIAVLVIGVLMVWLLSALNPIKYTYEEAEVIITNAAKKYFAAHPEQLPATDKVVSSMSYQTLVNAGYIKPLNELLVDANGCGAEIRVKKISNDYAYIVYLNCGNKYVTRELYQQILADHPVSKSGSGLYKTNKEYYFRGKVTNNYVKFGSVKKGKRTEDYLWRIVCIDASGNVKLKSVKSLAKSQWDDRYNADQRKVVGYNTFNDSVLAEALEKLYNENTLFTVEELSKLVPTKLCAGPRKVKDNSKTGNTECASKSKKQFYFGTMTPYEYMRASLDPNCSSLIDKSCGNYNYLSDRDHVVEWVITSDPETTSQAYAFDGKTFESTTAKSRYALYPTITLGTYAFYSGGTGTEADPYSIKLSTDLIETNSTSR